MVALAIALDRADAGAEVYSPPCRGLFDLFFSDEPDDARAAIRLCYGCAVRRPCLAGAIERREPCGVWGGAVMRNGVALDRAPLRGRPRAHA